MKQLILYHGTTRAFDELDPGATVDGGVHAGTAAQARMRVGKAGRIIQLAVTLEKVRRSRDRGGDWRQRIAAARREGFDAIVYLNRYEGLRTATVMDAVDGKVPLDELSDAAFRRRCPEAEDSYILLRSERVRVLDRDWKEP